jgi:hypothetical protein
MDCPSAGGVPQYRCRGDHRTPGLASFTQCSRRPSAEWYTKRL